MCINGMNFVYILILFFINNTKQYDLNYNSETITVGLIADQNVENMGIVFETAMEVAEQELGIHMSVIKDDVDYGDSFTAFNKLNKMIKMGIKGVFGPSSRDTVEHLATLCDANDLPYIHSIGTTNSDGFNLFINPEELANALFSIINAYEWNRFVFLYESAEYLNILTYLLDLYDNNNPFISVHRYDTFMDGNYKVILRRIRKSIDNQIVVIGSTNTIQEFLKQAQQVGIINKSYKFIIANLDFYSLDLDEYKYAEANITGLSMFSTKNPSAQYLVTKLNNSMENANFQNGLYPITTELALLYDSVLLFAEASMHLSLTSSLLNCSASRDCELNHGSSFKNYMRSMKVSKHTITGNIYFEDNMRKGYNLDILELQPSGIVQVGSWSGEEGFISKRLAPTNTLENLMDNSLANKTFRVLLSMNKPYSSLVESYKRLEGNNQYEGYCVDLIKELADKLGFNFTLIDGGFEYGEFNKTTNTTTGMMRQIINGEADLILTDLTITSERQEIMDFTIPFMNLGIAILYLKPQIAPPSLFSFMAPLSLDVWSYLGLSFLAVSLSFFLLGRLSPIEWDNPHPCIEDPVELENQFTIGNAFWFTTGALLQQGSEVGPKALSTKAVASFWMFFTLIMVSSYTANLAAFLTVTIPTTIIDNVEDLAQHKGGVVFGAKRSGATRNYFLFAEDEIYQRMNEFMTNNPKYLTENNQEGVRRVVENKNYAFLMESTSIDYNTMRECNLKKIGDALDEKGYGIAMRKHWPYRSKFNEAILTLQEQGALEKLKNKWWNEVGAGICTAKSEQSEASELNMDNLGGVYYVLVVGTTLALFYGLINWCLFVGATARRLNEPIKDSFERELRILMDINSYTREC